MNTFEKDENNGDILLSESSAQVMMEWEKPYMEASIDFLSPRGHVLEIGFGCGYSATQFMNHPIQSYTVIECDPVVIEKAKIWREQYPDIPIEIVEGTWQEKLFSFGVFDEIYFDDFPLNIGKESSQIEQAVSRKRFSIFVDLCMQNHTRIGSKISFYMNGNEQLTLSSDTEPFIEKEYRTMQIAIPKNCEYRNIDEQKCTIPLITKIKEYSFGVAQEWALQQMMKKGYSPHTTT
jgi:guanidinoacetate N-methyltransferase